MKPHLPRDPLSRGIALCALVWLSLWLFSTLAHCQTQPGALMPVPIPTFLTNSGLPNASGCLFSYSAGTSTPLATYADNLLTTPNANPLILNAAGRPSGEIFLSAVAYKFVLKTTGGIACASGSQIWTADNVSDLGALYANKSVLLNPAGAAEQDVIGPLGANYFKGLTNHTTSPNVRVASLDPVTTLDTATNPPTFETVAPAVASQRYFVPDPAQTKSSFVLSPNGDGTSNVLDCTQTGINCKRTAYVYFEGGGCNNTTAGMGWDTFGTNSPSPICITGTNVQKGVLALPAAVTYIQENTGTAAAAGTCTTTYPKATVAGDLLVVSVVVDGSQTVTGITDTTNAYSLAVAKTNGTLDLEIWYFANTSASKAASTTLTVTLSGNANCALDWKEYAGVVTGDSKDKTANNSGTGTAVTSGTTVGTAQNTELVLAAVGSPSNPTVTGASGFVKHSTVAQSTNVTVADEGLIQQATATQAGSFTLGSSQAWASAVVTFKAASGGSVLAQRSLVLPAFWNPSVNVNSTLMWMAPAAPLGTVNTVLGAQVVCGATGSTDDPAFAAPVTATVAVSASAANILTSTPLNALTAGPTCLPGYLMHFQIERLRFNASDTYEGYIYLNGAGLNFGITQ